MSPVRQWLAGLGFGQFADAFEQNRIDLDIARDLADQDLRDLGVTALGDRKLLLRAIASLKETTQEIPTDKSAAQAVAPVHEGERRQLTVLFCDMVGFTELANRVDPEVLQGIIRSYEDACAVCITRYEGYVFQRLGDGIVAFFGYPLAHEGEAERAIHAGLEIIASLSKLDVPDAGHLAVRVGIATGLVVVSSAEKGAVGETMNLASRLQGIAQPGSIAVSERVHRLAGGSFDYEDLGEQTLKGIARSIRAYRIVGVSEAASRFEAATQEGLTPLVGREQEIGLLLERWALAQDGEGQVVLLSGEPGIGKSRILSALRERLEATGAGTLRFQCSPYYINSAFYPSIDNFERALKFARDEPPESKLDKLESLIVGHYHRPLTDVRFIASMLSIPCEERYKALPITPQKFKDETLRTLVDLTEAAARKQPSVMLFEDMHWADPTSLEVLDLLIDRARTIPLLIVLTHRPEFQSRWSQHGHVTGLNLSKLTRAQSSAMVTKVTGGKALPAALLEQILAKTDGVPLFVEELTKSILESGELKTAGDQYEYVGTAQSVTIPATLRDSLMARLDRFMPVKEIAQIGAAIGREFSYELVAAVAPMAQAPLDAALVQLIDSGLAFRRGTPPDATYTFKHALVQDAAYDSLLKSRRQELHAKIARAIEDRYPAKLDAEPELLAHHYTQAADPRRAIPLWMKAGELAGKRIALQEAIRHLNRGLDLAVELRDQEQRQGWELEFHTTLGTVWMALKGWSAAEVKEQFAGALHLARALQRPERLVTILWGLWVNALTTQRLRGSLQWVDMLLQEAEARSDQELQIVGHWSALVSNFFLGDFIAGRPHAENAWKLYDLERFRHIADELNHDPKTTTGIYGAQVNWTLGFPDRAARMFAATEAHARRRAHPFDLCYVLTYGGGPFEPLSEPETLIAHAQEAILVGREIGMPFVSECLGQVALGIGLLRSGRLAESAEQLKRGLDAWVAASMKLGTAYLKALLGHAVALTGDPATGLSLVEEGLAQLARDGWEERYCLAEIFRLKGCILGEQGKLDEAEKCLRNAIDVAREQQAKSWELRTSTSLAKLWQGEGKRQEAHDLLAPVYDWFTEGFDTKDLKDAKALLDELDAR